MTCVQCHRPADAFLCPACTDRVHGWLRALVEHATDLEDVVGRLTAARGEQVQVRGTPETPLPINVEALEVRWVLHSTLAAVAKSLCEDRGVAYSGVSSPAGIAQWLALNVKAIALSPDALETYDVLRHLAATGDGPDQQPKGYVVKAVDIHPTPVFLGRCDHLINGWLCGDDVRALPEATTASCPGCGTKHDVVEFQRRALLRMGQELRTAREIGAVLNGQLRGDTVTRWKNRKVTLPDGSTFVAQGKTPWGAELFRVADVLDLLDRDKARMVRDAA